MKNQIKIGTTGEERFVVVREHLITFAEGDMPEVLSTPALIGVLERTARLAIAPLLDPGETSVGVEIHLEHLAAAPRGAEVVCRARVIHTDGKRITYQLEAHDQYEQLARGTHKRAVVETSRLARRMERKTQS